MRRILAIGIAAALTLAQAGVASAGTINQDMAVGIANNQAVLGLANRATSQSCGQDGRGNMACLAQPGNGLSQVKKGKISPVAIFGVVGGLGAIIALASGGGGHGGGGTPVSP